MLFFCDLCPLLCALFCFGSQSLISSLKLCCVTHYYPITTFYFSDAYNWFIFLLSDIKLISSQSLLFAFKISSFLLSNGYSLPNLGLVFWLSMIPFSYYPCYGHTINSICVLSPTQKKMRFILRGFPRCSWAFVSEQLESYEKTMKPIVVNEYFHFHRVYTVH